MSGGVNLEAVLAKIRLLAEELRRPIRLMEVCGTHTVAAFRTGLRSLLPKNVQLISGPGCPVCVTPGEYVDQAVAIAGAGARITTFGDMLRVPGSLSSLEEARAKGADVVMVYSPADALRMAMENPGRPLVFLGVGFETTTPAVAWTLQEARSQGVGNFSVLCAHKTIPEAMDALLAGGQAAIDGFMCPGHVSVIIGADAYDGLCRKYGIPCVVAGFEAADMAVAIQMLLGQIARNEAKVEIQYGRSVTAKGNRLAQDACDAVFEKADVRWRGLGVIPSSGLRMRREFEAYDADKVFAAQRVSAAPEPAGCRCGDVLKGILLPPQCPLFRKVCRPVRPVGPCMVSSEGACAAYHKYGPAEGSHEDR